LPSLQVAKLPSCQVAMLPSSQVPKFPSSINQSATDRPTDRRTDGRWRTNSQTNNTPNIGPLQIFNQGENLKSGVWQYRASRGWTNIAWMKFTKVGPKKSTLLYTVVVLYTVVHCCPLLSTVVHCCPLLCTVQTSTVCFKTGPSPSDSYTTDDDLLWRLAIKATQKCGK
jgi:hypothetical protein